MISYVLGERIEERNLEFDQPLVYYLSSRYIQEWER